MSNVITREARKDDCKEIRRLIQELADFEKMPDGPKIDVSVLEEDGFGSSNPSFGCFVAQEADKSEDGGKLIGFSLYFIAYSTWMGKSIYLEDLYVSPEFRGHGLGSKLFDLVAKRGLELGCKRMDFRVLNWNPAIKFYEHKGAVDLTKKGGWHNYGIDITCMEKLASRIPAEH